MITKLNYKETFTNHIYFCNFCIIYFDNKINVRYSEWSNIDLKTHMLIIENWANHSGHIFEEYTYDVSKLSLDQIILIHYNFT